MSLRERLRAQGFDPPDYQGGGLVNVAATVLDVLGLHDGTDPPRLAQLDPALREGARNVILIVADGLGWGQLQELRAGGQAPFLDGLARRAERGEGAQLMEALTIFPSTTTAAITTLNTARTPQEHGNIAYFTWLEEFGAVTQMLRWGRATSRRGSFFDDRRYDPRSFVKVPSIHERARARGIPTWLIEPDIFRNEAMTRMHAAEAEFRGYLLPTTLGVRLRELREWHRSGEPGYTYAYWGGIDTAAHWYGPGSPEEAAEAASFDLALSRAFAGAQTTGPTLVLLVADHGHAAVDPDRLIDLDGDAKLRSLLRNPLAGEPRLVLMHTDHPDRVKAHLEARYPGAFVVFDREEAISEGLFGRGDPALVRKRVGEVCALVPGDRGATLVRVDGGFVLHRGSHGGMTPEEMRIPVLAWRC